MDKLSESSRECKDWMFKPDSGVKRDEVGRCTTSFPLVVNLNPFIAKI
jgi:hypothetical protein